MLVLQKLHSLQKIAQDASRTSRNIYTPILTIRRGETERLRRYLKIAHDY